MEMKEAARPQSLAFNGTCGACAFARPADSQNLAGPDMTCYRYPPTPIIIPLPNGSVSTPGSVYPIVRRQTMCCGEFAIKPGLAQ